MRHDDEAFAAADAVIAEHGRPLSDEALRTMLALAWGVGNVAGLIEGRDLGIEAFDKVREALA